MGEKGEEDVKGDAVDVLPSPPTAKQLKGNGE